MRRRYLIGALLLAGAGGGALGQPPAGAAEPATAGAAPSAPAARWAYPRTDAVVRASTSSQTQAVGRLHDLTEDSQPEVYAVLSTQLVPRTHLTWAQVALPGRPNGRTGWVPARTLGALHTAQQRLVVDRHTLRAVLYGRGDRVLWTARVGVGRASLPTPAGHFYVREKLRTIGGPAYGPFAIGTSAYAPTLTDWPGGGVVGLHGTDQPGLIPGRPSHGCVRLRNGDVTRLWRLIAIGTPIDIR